jgi:peptide/nickel transport system ATP-binding protein
MNPRAERTLAGVLAPSAIDVRNLRVACADDSADIVEDASFALRPGEILGLVGESGSGKSTLALALLAYSRRGLRVAEGSVRIGDIDLLALDAQQLRQARGSLISYVPQDPGTALNPALRVRTQLTECLELGASERESRLQQLLEEVKLSAMPRVLDAYPHQLSGGQQQRIAIAMAFARRPRVIVMDEPTTGLDVTTQAHVLETIRQLCARHAVAAVYVSHDLAVVAGLATYVAVLYAGRIVELGPTERVLQRPDHPYTRALIRAVPDLDGRLALHGLPGQAPDPWHRSRGCAFATRCELAAPACRVRPPPVMQIADEHEVRCFRAERCEELPRFELRGALLLRRTADPPLLRLRNLVAWYGTSEILHAVSLDLPPHSCTALVGESGSGKSTLARCVGGLHDKLTGSMEFAGAPLRSGSRRRSPELRRRIQYVFQNPYASLNPKRTIAQSIAIALREFERLPQAETRERVASALQSVALPLAAGDRYPHQLSGGQRQLAAIARALIVEPELLICDEVTSSLDVCVQAVAIELLQQLQQTRGLTLLFVTHNLALVRNIAQQVAVLQAGRLVEHGSMTEVLERPQASETRSLLQNAPRFAGPLDARSAAAVRLRP